MEETRGQKLRRMRKERNLTIGEVATAIGVSKGFMSLLEKDKSGIRASRALELAKFFGVDVKEPLFDPEYASLGVGIGSPACLCPAGLERMAKELVAVPQQYRVNIAALKKCNDEFLTGASLLEAAYSRCLAEKKHR